MIINKSSWHYRLLNKFAPSPVRWYDNLCSYMRVLIGVMLLLTFIIPSLLYGMGEIVALVFMGREWFKEIWLEGLYQFGGSLLGIHGLLSIIAGGCAWVLFCAGLIAAGIDAIRSKIESKKVKHTIEGYMMFEESIFKTWWRSFHDKTCPMIEYKDSK